MTANQDRQPKRPAKTRSGAPADPARSAALATHMAVISRRQVLETALPEHFDHHGLTGRDRAFAATLVYTALRRHGSLSALLASLMDKPLKPARAAVQSALLLGLTQILLLRTQDHGAVDGTVRLVKARGKGDSALAGLVNAILRRAIRERADLVERLDIDPLADLPAWLKDDWASTLGSDACRAVARTLRTEPPVDLSLRDPAGTGTWAATLGGTPLPTGAVRLTRAGDVTALPGYREGQWWVQDMAASLPVRLLGAIGGSHVLDLCAAPGGKTLQLAAAGARVTAVDRSEKRLARLHANLARTGLTARVAVADALEYTPPEPVDHILLDAPCSATGTLRRNPDTPWVKGPDDVTRLAALQAKLLDRAFALLPPGGVLVYCVCSLQSREGPDQVAAFLDRTPQARRQALPKENLGPLAEAVTETGDIRTHPGLMADAGGMDGFYMARLIRPLAAG
ncbi:RsmB/NOP family class I SAM-dependent RNA methyltransferase [Yunchengibacter salinarum]|uniref:RsmB/NOP family class I SAM-dependent RNA methyltransferase n=1 Tax=Yunchengibacter salinarum TaxID=3133399 RepID=UPI0035B5DD8F